MDKRRKQAYRQRHQEAADLVTRLTVIQGMYKAMMKVGVGTVSIESEAMRLVYECVSGPTGHRLLSLDSKNEGEVDVLVNSREYRCWRDPKLVKKLTGLRLRIVSSKLCEARRLLSEEMRLVALVDSKSETGRKWQEVRDVQHEVWRVENPKHQLKVAHMVQRSSKCESHKVCRSIDCLAEDRWRRSVKSLHNQVGDIMVSEAESESVVSDAKPVDPASRSDNPDDPDSLLSSRYFSRPEDLERVNREESQMKRVAQSYNHSWKPDHVPGCASPAEGTEVDNEVIVYGEVELTQCERDLLSLGPGFMVVSQLNDQEMKVESAVTLMKIRWSRRSQGTDGMTANQEKHEYVTPTEEESSLSEALESEARDVLSSDGSELNMGRTRPTNMRNNRDVMMPGPARSMVEAEYNTRVGERAYKSFKSNHCKEDGTQCNLTQSQQVGLRTLAKKTATNQVIVLQADKGKKFVVVDQQTYLSMGQDHTSKDKVVTPGQVRASQKVLSTTTRSLVNILGVGTSQSHHAYTRCLENSDSRAEDVPTMKVLPKVHKLLSASGHPQSRPVVTAASGISSRVGDLISDFLEPLVGMDVPRLEDQSTEEVLAQLEQAETAIRDAGLTDTVVGSLDVRALYPSLDQLETSKLVSQFILKSKVKLSGIDWREAQSFLASNMSELEVKN